ncbi:MAG: hypothetical protein WDN76_12095 [Alphaproteobacteria bacterium]
MPARYGYGRVAGPDAQVLDLRGLLPKAPDSGPLLPAEAKAKPVVPRPIDGSLRFWWIGRHLLRWRPRGPANRRRRAL